VTYSLQFSHSRSVPRCGATSPEGGQSTSYSDRQECALIQPVAQAACPSSRLDSIHRAQIHDDLNFCANSGGARGQLNSVAPVLRRHHSSFAKTPTGRLFVCDATSNFAAGCYQTFQRNLSRLRSLKRTRRVVLLEVSAIWPYGPNRTVNKSCGRHLCSRRISLEMHDVN